MSPLDRFLAVLKGEAEAHVVEEPPGSNRTRYGQAYGLDGQPWCAIFVWWCLTRAGLGGAVPKTASVPVLYHWARSMGYVDSTPTRGALACFDWGSDGVPDHIGPVWAVTGAHSFQTIEGNTSPNDRGPQSNGDGVYLRDRVTQLVAGFIHLPTLEDTVALTPEDLAAIAKAVWMAGWTTTPGKPAELAQDRLVQAARGGGLTDDVTALAAQVAALRQEVHAGTPVVLSQAQIDGIAAAVAAQVAKLPAGTSVTAGQVADEIGRRLRLQA